MNADTYGVKLLAAGASMDIVPLHTKFSVHTVPNHTRDLSGGCGRTAFTAVELLVVIAVVSLLALLSVSATSVPKDQTKTTVCASNIRQLLMASQIFAADNRDQLPQLVGSVAWAWDLPHPAAESLLRTGVEKKHFYCPSTSPRFTDKENWAAPGIGTSSSLWNFGVFSNPAGPTAFHLIGYVLAYSGSDSRLQLTNQNRTIQPERPSGGSLVVAAAERVLVADVALSAGNALPGHLNPTNNYISIVGGFMQNGVSYPHVSNHLKGDVPTGGNLGFKDGHVDWRNFNQMVPRSARGPWFWW